MFKAENLIKQCVIINDITLSETCKLSKEEALLLDRNT